MLESGAIQTSQSAWCNTVVLVRKKERLTILYWLLLPECTYKKGLLPPAKNSGGAGESSRCWTFFLPRPQIGVLANKNGGGIKAIYCLHSRQFEVLQIWPHALWAVQCTSYISEADAKNCLSKLKLIYCLIYLDDTIIFLQMVEEHLHRLCVVFDRLREYNLKPKASKCSHFKEEINYLAHQVSKEIVWPTDLNLRAITEYASPQTYMKIWAFLSLVSHYQWIIKGFVHIAQLLNGLLSGEGASRKLEWVLLLEDALRAFKALKTGVHEHPSPSLCQLYQRIPTRNWCI